MRCADVAVQVPAQPGAARPDTTRSETETGVFTYLVPDVLAGRIRVGQWVWVPFRTQHVAGVVMALDTNPPDVKLRQIADIVDDRPVLTQEQLALARWMSRYYLAPIYECLSLFLPPGSAPRVESVYRAGTREQQDVGRRRDRFTPLQLRVLDLLERHGDLTEEQVASLAARESLLRGTRAAPAVSRALESLVQRGAVQRVSRLAPPRVGPSWKPAVRLLAQPREALHYLARSAARGPRWLALLLLVEADEAGSPLVPLDEVLERSGASLAEVRQLAAEDLVALLPEATLLSAPGRQADDTQPYRETLERLRSAGPRTMPELEKLGFEVEELSRLVSLGLVEEHKDLGVVALRVPPEEARERVIAAANLRAARRALEELVQRRSPMWLADLARAARCGRASVERLAEAGIVAIEQRRYYRDRFLHRSGEPSPLPTLTEDQALALAPIVQALDGGRPRALLLQGVTGSGKTEVYLHAIEHALSQGKQAMALVPEISLTPQALSRYGRYFPGRVAVQHSQLTPGERYDQWTNVRDGLADVVVGPRSALFMPLPRCGLIILDEEHDPSYKQANRPCYHARDTALRLAQESGAVVVLGSATPDVCTYRAAARGALQLLSLPRRYGPDEPPALPAVEVVDMRAELRAGHTGILSRRLESALRSVLAQGEQAILFLNRRGTSTFVMCRDCGYVARCPRCDLPFTYHTGAADSPSPSLICHHCGRRDVPPSTCPECASVRIRHFGAGTERVAAYARAAFPGARVVRWDWDTTRERGGHEQILDAFLRHQADILVGTQMVAKGLDLPLVTLVGVVSADVSLFFPDFRAGERAFQLLTQVAGRAGRRERGGHAIIQTYHPDHYAIRAAAQHDYEGFYAREIAMRRRLGYPPFGHMVRLLYTGSSASKAEQAAFILARRLTRRIRREGLPNLEVIGPAPCFYSRLRGRYRWHVLLRGEGAQDLLRHEPPPPGWRVDVDPLDFL
ncbi:MAG: primosomal protein N' [Anaerolineae bacterium]|nr:primosomal protein N' [Anaerolineae bacterium]